LTSKLLLHLHGAVCLCTGENVALICFFVEHSKLILSVLHRQGDVQKQRKRRRKELVGFRSVVLRRMSPEVRGALSLSPDIENRFLSTWRSEFRLKRLISLLAFLLVYTVSALISLSSSLQYLCFVYTSGRQAHVAATESGELSMQ